MLNIEIHGLGLRSRAEGMAKRIFQVFSDKSYVDEMVVTIFPSFVQNKKGELQPFLRLLNSHQEEQTKEIIERLGQFEMDIEHLELKAFYPKKKTKTG